MAGYSTPAWSNGTSPAISAANLLAMGRAIEMAQHPYGTCSTPAATAAKAVTVDVSGTVSLFNGMTVRVKFTYANTAENPTLNVNSTGAKAIRSYGTAQAVWSGNQVLTLTYDSTMDCWLVSGKSDGGVQMKTGSYTGSGEYGSTTPTSITFPFSPKLVIACRADGCLAPTNTGWRFSFLWIYGQTIAPLNNGSATSNLTISQNGNTLSYYSTTGSAYQLNQADTTYIYFGIGS